MSPTDVQCNTPDPKGKLGHEGHFGQWFSTRSVHRDQDPSKRFEATWSCSDKTHTRRFIMTTTSRITLTAAEKIAFNRFMSEVAPKLEANSTGSVATLTAEEVLLAVQGLSISALYKAEAEGLTIEVARDIVFGSVYNGLDAATQALLLEAVEVAVTPDTSASDSPTAPGNLAKGLDLIGQIITKSGSIISKAFSAAFSKVSSILTSLFNWSAAQVKAVATYVQTVTLPWAQRTSIAIWDWTSQSIMTISRAAWKCIRAVAGAVKGLGKLDILVNNAGITKDAFLVRMSDEDWDAVISVNLRGTFLFSRSAAKPMMKQKSGVVVNIASVIGLIGNAGQCNYAASKAGVIALTKSAAKELASRNIRVNAVAPGFIETKMTEVLSEDIRNKMLELIPLKRFGAPADVAKVVLFLASDASSYITGQVVTVSGGMVM